MTILEAIDRRHSVRCYSDKRISKETAEQLQNEIALCNREGGLHIQLITEEESAFGGFAARYGKFSGVRNYLAVVGEKAPDLEERAGYYGERIALTAQTLGLNTCWVAMTVSKREVRKNIKISRGEKLVIVLALGYGETQGRAHKSKEMDRLCTGEDRPLWFENGMRAAMLAPTAMNQQRFLISCRGNRVAAESSGGFYSDIDLGIVKYHFEVGAGKENFEWESGGNEPENGGQGFGKTDRVNQRN